MAEQTVKSSVLILALRAAVTGVFVFVLVGIASIYRGSENPWLIACLVGSIAAFLSWVVMIMPKSSTRVEFPKVPPVGLNAETTRIQVTGDQSSFQHGTWLELSISPNTISQVAKRIAAGGTFSYSSLAGPGKPLTRAQFENLRDLFIARGLAYWINPDAHGQGCKLSRAGEAVLRHFVGRNDPVTSYLPQLPTMSRRRDNSPSSAHAHTRTRAPKLLQGGTEK